MLKPDQQLAQRRDEAEKAYLAACDLDDKAAKDKWLKEYNNYDDAVKYQEAMK